MIERAVLWTECQRCGTRVPFSVDEVLRLHREGRELALRCPGCGRRLTVGRDDIPRRLCAWGGAEGGIMSNTHISLQRWELGEWPEYITVSHEGMREPGRRHVPERTCHAVDEEHTWECDRCGYVGDSVTPGYRFCPNCGARVVE
ncbi:hypothetical protein H6A08_09355 [Enorma massiliensis]|uniref:hypothetical protein n=1 Tax=Enorma massiliensis TaxID=1472761 RepID=UPI00195E853D|nr:hypothetical protein [Enorma massiliensis]MBM6784556.1 hypothetical protein [Enorma massiliensis]